ncbi:dihydrolipoamide acetyltransferase family protein [Thermoflavimicrobium daqui]|uniref:Dihydrolipoamide acetyltransferase component of pyruvate dehydrogenase complex n=1 Tax=Thermoflavimicrobium daqui TaxID=2137476 RepID=A0A364K146_9BACL|nr:dihydrolipoamide acetyltransferase family protein [Thermoflavimicrobium daqui]RAL21335.1 2-oxo acid dehydrogenase subunit E2 [Thermoflavimicrobium daqui]
MTIPFQLPDVGEGVAEAEIVRWLVRIGDAVAQDEAVCEVATDKAVVELPAPQAGKIIEIHFQEGETAPVGSTLFTLQPTDERSSQSIQDKISPKKEKRKRVLATPSTRRLARELKVDLSEVKGTGENGRILEEDIRSFLEERSALKEEVRINSLPIREQFVDNHIEEVTLSPVRKVIAERLLFSITKKPHATHFTEMNVEGLVEWRKKRLQDQGTDEPRLTYLPILLKMIAVTLRTDPKWNSHFDEERQVIRTFSSISIGIATDTPRGLLVPVVHEVEKKSIADLSSEVRQLTELARLNRLTSDQLTGSTFTVSNAGALGGTWATPIINPPEVAILAIHPIERRPVVSTSGEIVAAWRMNVSLSFDHRVLDGADAIRFTTQLEKYTADPGRLVQELR